MPQMYIGWSDSSKRAWNPKEETLCLFGPTKTDCSEIRVPWTWRATRSPKRQKKKDFVRSIQSHLIPRKAVMLTTLYTKPIEENNYVLSDQIKLSRCCKCFKKNKQTMYAWSFWLWAIPWEKTNPESPRLCNGQHPTDCGSGHMYKSCEPKSSNHKSKREFMMMICCINLVIQPNLPNSKSKEGVLYIWKAAHITRQR